VGGLSSATADPTGVFIMRNEPAEIANIVLGRNDLLGAQRLIYVLDLTQPNGMFMARDFSVRDDDTLYVTEAPFSQWSKVIAAMTGTLSAVGSVSTAGTTLTDLGL
jgi:polysaccharide export outer membrane protein